MVGVRVWMTGAFPPLTGGVTPVPGTSSPTTGAVAPVTGAFAPEAGGVAPMTGASRWITGEVRWMTGATSPVTGECRWNTGEFVRVVHCAAQNAGVTSPAPRPQIPQIVKLPGGVRRAAPRTRTGPARSGHCVRRTTGRARGRYSG